MSGIGMPAARAAELCARILRSESQNAIFREMGVAKATIRRFIAQLQSQGVELVDRPISPPRHAQTENVLERIKSTDDSNRTIGRELNVPICTVGRIRKNYYASLSARGIELPKCPCGLDLHHPRLCSFRQDKLLEKRGIAGIVAVSGRTVSDVIDLLMQGNTLQSVADTIGASKISVRDFLRGLSPVHRAQRREALNVATGRRRTAKMRSATRNSQRLNPNTDATYEAISKIVPRSIDAALRDDIISEAYVEFIYGRIKQADLRAGVRRVQNRMFAAFSNRWGDLSLDAAISEEGNETWVAQIEDPSALEAFERIG